MSHEYNATVTMRADLAPGTMVIRIKLDGEAFPYEAGQYTVLGLKRSSPRLQGATPESAEMQQRPADFMIRRAYSITSNSQEDELEFVVTLVRSGDLTPRLFALREGSRISVDPRASGIFTLRTASGNRDLLLVATGAALAPYLAMLRSEFAKDQEHQYVIVHAAAVSDDLCFRTQMEELSEQTSRFTYVPVIFDSERDPDWQGLSGPVEELLKTGEIEDLLGLPISPDRFDVFLAGAPEMIDAVSAQLESLGFSAGPISDPQTDIHVERYW
jgi:ferredoxin--NADP+ reductase